MTLRGITRAGHDWLWRALVVAVFAACAAYTWGHWGDLRVDTGHEMYIPAAIAGGKMLYRDLWYPYCPLAPYAQALIFLLFGVHLNVLYFSGLALTLCCALFLFSVSRRLLPNPAAAVVALAFLLQAFSPDEFNYVLPYTHAADYAMLFGFITLYLIVRHVRDEAGPNLLLAGLAAGLATLSKQEFGAAAWLVVFAAIALRYVSDRSFSMAARRAAATLPGIALVAAVLGYFVWRLSAGFLLFENFLVTPGSHFMRVYGSRWVSERGLRFVPSEITATIGIAILSMLFWYAAARLARLAWPKRALTAGAAALAIAAGVILVAFIRQAPWAKTLVAGRGSAEVVFYPKGMYWITLGLFAWKLIRYLRFSSDRKAVPTILVVAYAIANGIRIMVQVEPRNYAIYYNPILFLTFVIFLVEIFRRVLWDLPARTASARLYALLAAEACALLVLLIPQPANYPAILHTDYGTIYTRPAEAAVFPRVISFLKEKQAAGKHVLAQPEEVVLYFFAGLAPPTRWYQLTPGSLLPEQEDKYIAELECTGIDYVLLSNRTSFEYGVPYFGLDYHQKVYRWIEDHYQLIGQFGTFERKLGAPYAFLVYEKRPADSAAAPAVN